jgi:hypothetical protein
MMKKHTAISVVIVALTLSALPFTSFAKGKPGGGGGDPVVPLTDPAIVYSANVSVGTTGLVMSNADGTIKQTLYTGENESIGDPEFIPGRNAIVFTSTEFANGGGINQGNLVLLNYSVDPIDGVTVDANLVELDSVLGDNFFIGIDVSPDGNWILYRAWMGDGNNVLRLKSLTDLSAPPVQISFLDLPMGIWNAVWLKNSGNLAVSYNVSNTNDGRIDRVDVFQFDPTNLPTDLHFGQSSVLATLQLPDNAEKWITGQADINSANTRDSVVVTVTVDTGRVVKHRGQVRRIINYVLHEWNIGSNSFLPLGQGGIEIVGSLACFSPDDNFVLTDGEYYGSEFSILKTEVSTGNYWIIEDAQASSPDWNSDWVAP